MFSEYCIIDNQWEARNMKINSCGRKAKEENNGGLPQAHSLRQYVVTYFHVQVSGHWSKKGSLHHKENG